MNPYKNLSEHLKKITIDGLFENLSLTKVRFFIGVIVSIAIFIITYSSSWIFNHPSWATAALAIITSACIFLFFSRLYESYHDRKKYRLLEDENKLLREENNRLKRRKPPNTDISTY